MSVLAATRDFVTCVAARCDVETESEEYGCEESRTANDDGEDMLATGV